MIMLTTGWRLWIWFGTGLAVCFALSVSGCAGPCKDGTNALNCSLNEQKSPFWREDEGPCLVTAQGQKCDATKSECVCDTVELTGHSNCICREPDDPT